jgi:lipoprotein-releasing system ATP-binding protein
VTGSAAPAAAAVPVLAARGLRRTLGTLVTQEVIRGVDLTVAPGEFVALTGPSGSGKSTLLYLLGVLDRPSAGEVLVLGEPTAALADDARAELRNQRIGFVFQFHFLLPEFSAEENVAIPLLRRGVKPRLARERAAYELAGLGLGDRRARRPGELSGGEQQRVAVARALAGDPALLLADEPTGNLDSANAENVFGVFERLAAAGRLTLVMVTHDLGLAGRAPRRLELHDGAIVAEHRRG